MRHSTFSALREDETWLLTGLVAVIAGFLFHWRGVINLLANGFLVCAIGMVFRLLLIRVKVPCGFPATVTSILTLIARKMAAKNVYLKRLDVVEALGSASIIATDKTGTLTKNIMTVTHLWHFDNIVSGLVPLNAWSQATPRRRMTGRIWLIVSATLLGGEL